MAEITKLLELPKFGSKSNKSASKAKPALRIMSVPESVPGAENPNNPFNRQHGQESSLGDRDDTVLFARNDGEQVIGDDSQDDADAWKIMLVDDEPEVHRITQLALDRFEFEGKPLQFLNAYSGAEARDAIVDFPDTAIIFLDIVMETENEGLELVQYIRETLDNQVVRIILRTGQPGRFEEDVVALQYGINDYKTKTELTRRKLMTTIATNLRVFKALVTIEDSKRELERISLENERIYRQIQKYALALESKVLEQKRELERTTTELQREREERRIIEEKLNYLASLEGFDRALAQFLDPLHDSSDR